MIEILESLNDELNTLNIKIGFGIAGTRGTESEKAIQALKCNMIVAQKKFVEEIEKLYYK